MQGKRIGRPTKAAKPGERVSLGLKVTPSIKGLLDEAARTNGRTQSQEAEVRLERSFEREGLLPDTLSSRYGEPLAGIVLMIGDAMAGAGRAAGFSETYTLDGAADWHLLPYAFDQAARAADSILAAIRPAGEASPPTAMRGLAGGLNLADVAENLGAGFANTILEEGASGLARTSTRRRDAAMLRDLVGDILARRLKPFDRLTDEDAPS